MHPLAVALNLGERGVALMLAAAVALYVASRAAADALTGGRPPTAGRLAVGHWTPVAVVAVVAAATGQFAVAVGLVFATAAGCLSLGLGTLATVAPAAVVPVGGRRAWPLLVPAGLLSLLVGFHRQVRPWDAVALAVEGLCVLALWTERTSAAAVPRRPGVAVLGTVQFALAVALAGVGACLALLGLTSAAGASEAATPGLLTATFLGPLVVLPILGTAADLAHRGSAAAGEAASALVGVALLDVCAGLPLVSAVAAGRAWAVGRLADDPAAWDGWHRLLGVAGPAATAGAATAGAATRPAAVAVPWAVPFPLAVWRVDVVVVLALSVAVLPVGLGRWPLSRGQGAALLVAYAAYLFLALRVGLGNV